MLARNDHTLEDPIICGQPIRGRKHICALVNSREEQYDILMPFLRQGFEQSDMIPIFRFENTYLKEGHFSADRMIDLIRETVVGSRKNGYPRMRGFGEMHWAQSGLPGTDELIEYEARVNDVWDEYQDPILCVYDLKQVSGRMLMDLLCTHPKVILGGRIIENEFYMPPKEFLKDYRKRQGRPG